MSLFSIHLNKIKYKNEKIKSHKNFIVWKMKYAYLKFFASNKLMDRKENTEN